VTRGTVLEKGDTMKFTETQEADLERLYPYLVDLAEIIVRDRDEAHVAVQDACVRILEGPEYDPSRGASFKTWVTSYVVSQSINCLRSRRGAQNRHSLSDEAVLDEVEKTGATNPEEGFLVVIDIDKALGGLREEEATVLRRVWYEGYTLDELARRFPEYQGSRYVVHRLHNRARANMRTVLLSYAD
jgi:RNA polymerase sigma factor (sigma-70 family)